MEKHAIIEIGLFDTHDKDVSNWSPDTVCKWMKQNGHPQYESCVREASFNGEKLLKLSRESLYLAPFYMTDSNEIDQLNICIESLKNSQLNKYMKTFEYERNGKRNGYKNHNANNHSKSNGLTSNGYLLKEEIISVDGNYQYHSNDKTPLLSEENERQSLHGSGSIPSFQKHVYHNLRKSISDMSALKNVYINADNLELCKTKQAKKSQHVVSNLTPKYISRLGIWLVKSVMCICEGKRMKVMEKGITIQEEGWDSPNSSSRILHPYLRSHNADHHRCKNGDELSSSGHSCVENYPTEIFKTIVSIGYMFTAFFVSVFTLQLVHERVPSMTEEPPLPDIFFDIVPRRVEKAFSVCESIGMILTGFVLVLVFFHKHRSIIVRRIFFILGTLYFYRSITIYVTTLPVPGMHFKCAPKANGKLSVMIGRAFGLLFGGGLSLTGSHHLCGDYLFSGHTIILVVTYLTIHEYSPKRWWWLHWVSWLLSATGIVCILLAHDHYTIDVVIAYLLTTRLFWSYHTMCNIAALKDGSNSNMLSRAWWFNIFAYFEGNVASNGALPRQYEWPLPWPRYVSTSSKRSPIKGV